MQLRDLLHPTAHARRERRARLRQAMRRGVLATLGLQVSTAGGLLVFDSLRKRDRPDQEFPHEPPIQLPIPAGDLRIYTYGEDLYRAMLSDIESATDHIYLETYIWKDDAQGRDFRDALIRADARGVEVYLVVDEFANLVVPRSFFTGLPESIHFARHALVSGGWKFMHPRYSGRNHRKLLMVDASVAYVGGYNIGSLYATKWRDTHTRLTGDMVVEFENAFVDYWNIHAKRGREEPLPQPADRTWATGMQLHRNVPRDFVYPIRNMYMEAIDRAEHRIWLTQAYFIPDDPFLRGLVQAAKRGVDVRIIVPHFSNHIVADWLSRVTYDRLLKGGVRLLRFEGAMVHAKTATIDGLWSTIGTANIDRLSLAGNYEVNMEILNQDVARRMEEIFDLDSGNCTELTLEEWTKRPLISRFTEGVLSPWRPLL